MQFNQAAEASTEIMKTVENIVKVEDCLSSDEQEGKKEEQEKEMEEVDVQNSVFAQSGSASSEQQNLSSESEGFDPMGAASTPTRSVQSTPEQLHQVKQPLIAELPYGYWEYQPNQVPSAEPKPKTKSQQKHAKKDHQVRRHNQVFSSSVPSHHSLFHHI